jgi:CHAT domain
MGQFPPCRLDLGRHTNSDSGTLPLSLGEGRGEGESPDDKSPSPCPRPKGEGLLIAFAAVLIATLAPPAAAQVGDDIPRAPYYLAVQTFYAGEYRDAERGLRRETQRGVRTAQARWIDSICYHTMLGEVLYHQGRNQEALAEFDQACQVLLAYPNWLLQVKFLQPPRPDLARARRVPPWGQSERQSTLGQFAETEQVFIGELDPSRALREGGAFRTPMFWRVNVVEVLRTSALAIRRRGELLGPLAAHDRLTKELSDVFARGNLSPPNHWSSAWIDLLRGLTQAGIGKLEEADMLLSRAVLIEGQFDHPLTCVALTEQGRIAMIRGDTRRAAQLLAEAGFSAYYYENWDALTESIWLGWINHMASGAATVYPPLEPVADWTQLNRMQHIAAKLRLAQAESLLWLGQLDPAAAAVEAAARRIGEMRGGLTSIHQLYLQANLQLLRGQITPGSETLAQAIAAQAAASLRNFQIGRTGEMYDARAISARIATDLYTSLLADPRPADWAFQPLDVLAVLKTPHEAAFDRWFFAAMERKDIPLALEIAERAKRRRFLSSLPLGGRLLALSTILEAPENTLSRAALLERQQFLAIFPAYRELAEAGAAMQDALRAGSIVEQVPADAKPLAAQYDAWAANTRERQQFLMQLAPRRLPSSLEFPPLRTTAELQASLDDGEALVEFHAVGENLHGFLVTRTGVHAWQVADVRRLRSAISDFLRALGNYGGGRTLSAEELTSDRWQAAAAEVYAAIFAAARLDLAKTTSLVIVPDDVLWYLPFEALIPAGIKPASVLADRVPLRYGPTAALALRRPQPLRRPLHTGVVANHVKFGKDDAETGALVEQLREVQPGAVPLPEPLPEPPHLVGALLDGLIVLDDVDAERMTGSNWLPLPRSRGGSDDAGESWLSLPLGRPERIVVTGLATAAENGLKGSRRTAARDVRPGSEMFQTLCGMMAGGARTVLVSRWRTGGRTNLELVREFTQELSQSPATVAWQRACLLAREAPLDAENEPRLRGLEEEGELATADHPFFWAGYLLVDTGPVADVPDGNAETKPQSDAPANNKDAPLPAPVRPENSAAPPAADTDAAADSSTSKTPK